MFNRADLNPTVAVANGHEVDRLQTRRSRSYAAAPLETCLVGAFGVLGVNGDQLGLEAHIGAAPCSTVSSLQVSRLQH